MKHEKANQIKKSRIELRHGLYEKIKESVSSVLPITLIVLLLHFTITPISGGSLALFIIGVLFLIIGMGLFTLGADLSMMPMGESVGAELIKARKIIPLVVISLIMGIFITLAEPDLHVLAEQISAIPRMTLVFGVAIGVGIFIVIALLRILLQIQLNRLLIPLFAAIFILAAFAPGEFLPLAFDSGGVTTGPITVPFILALGIGVASVRGGKTAHEDSFGLVAICSIGPVLAVLILSLIHGSSNNEVTAAAVEVVDSVGDLARAFGRALPEYMKDVATALFPVIVFFAFFQIVYLHLPKSRIIRMCIGLLYTYVGIVLFFTGVNVGFLPVGTLIGSELASLEYNWILIPLGALMGFFVVMAEPAVHVLNKQVEEITIGAITRRSMLFSLSVGVALSVALSMIRVLTGISIWWFILPGYAIALGFSFFVPKIFTAIAFDSGGVASGTMIAAFMLPFAIGASSAVGGNVQSDAFGIIAMVAMTPLVTIQILGVVYKRRLHVREREQMELDAVLALLEADEIIDFDDNADIDNTIGEAPPELLHEPELTHEPELLHEPATAPQPLYESEVPYSNADRTEE